MIITVEEARKKLWPEYDQYTDKQIEDLILNYTTLVSPIVEEVWEEHKKEKED